MRTPDEARARLARLMNDRRVELGLRWTDVSAAGGLSAETLRAVRRDIGPLRDLTKVAIDKGLRWEQGSVQRILDGGDPRPAGIPAAIPPLTGDQMRRVLALVDEMLRESERGA